MMTPTDFYDLKSVEVFDRPFAFAGARWTFGEIKRSCSFRKAQTVVSGDTVIVRETAATGWLIEKQVWVKSPDQPQSRHFY